MSYKTYKDKVIPPHGGYEKLESFKTATIISDGTMDFCRRYKSYLTFKTYDQMTGAARSGKQSIAEGSINSGTSKKLELKLIGNARGSFGELLEDYKDFIRHNHFDLWQKDDPRVREIRALAYKTDKTYETYKSYMETPEGAANMLICLTHQVNYLLDQQLRALEKAFLEEGGFTERLYNIRKESRKK